MARRRLVLASLGAALPVQRAARAQAAPAPAPPAAKPSATMTPPPPPARLEGDAATAAATAATAASAASAASSADDDADLWLEDVEGERALAWVRERNAESEARLRSLPGFDALRTQLREVLDSRGQIPYVTRLGPHLYNLWRDAANPRGLWRRTSLAEYRRAEPAWETVLDLDALGRAEGKSWVWGGATPFGPAYRRCLLALSVGGADATVVREFDLVDKQFVAPADGAFVVPEAKTRVDWLDADTLVIGTDFGAGSLTTSGYPRVIKRWRRGQPLAEAVPVFEAEPADVSAWVSVDATPGFERTTFGRHIDFYRSRMWLLAPAAAGSDATVLKPIDKPEDATLAFWRERVLIELRSDWAVAGRTWPAGSLLVADAAAYLAGARALTALFTPAPTRSLAGWTTTRSQVIVNVLDNVASRLEEWRPGDGGWTKRDVRAPYPGSLSAGALHDPLLERQGRTDPLAEHYLLNAADFLEPDSLQLGRTGSDERERLKARPRFFDAEGQRVEQRFATSRDGTRVPYFVVWPRGAKAAAAAGGGDHPTLLYGYGGFEVSMLPAYSGTIGRAWTTRGGVYVLANLRGGGEFGPAWHQAALKDRRQKSFDDFIAVAEDLVAAGITKPARLGIMGGSNGGLLVGAVLVQRPELFGAVVCQVPLLDMRRYHRLLAGASWMAEYGNPDDPAEWAFIRSYSPFHNVPWAPGSAGSGAPARTATLPPVLIDTSTRDDRVHPGHARRFARRLAARGHRALYWENLEGGHGGAADNAQRSLMMALEYSFLWQTLAPDKTRSP